MQGSSRTTLKMIVFVFMYVKGQKESDYSSVNWKLEVVKTD